MQALAHARHFEEHAEGPTPWSRQPIGTEETRFIEPGVTTREDVLLELGAASLGPAAATTGCAAEAPPALSPEKRFLAAVKPAQTTREQVLLEWGPPSAEFEGGAFLRITSGATSAACACATANDGGRSRT